MLQRELTERWRSRRAPVTLTLYLSVLGGILYLLYRVGQSVLASQMGFRGGVDAASMGPLLGRFLLEGLLFGILLLVLFVAPAYAAAQLSGERERRTLPLLQVTLLRPWQIAAGKLGAATAWLVLLISAALPLGAGAFFLGGVALADLLRGITFILVVAVGIAGMALGVSALARRTTGAIVLTYGLVMALVGGTTVVSVAEAILEAQRGSYDRSSPPVALYANPFFGLADAVRAAQPSSGFFAGPTLPSPLGVIAEALPQPAPMDDVGDFRMERGFVEERFEGGFEGGQGMAVAPLPVQEPVGDLTEPPPREPVWLQVMGVYLLIGGLGFAVATHRLRTAEVSARIRGGRRRQRRPRREQEVLTPQ